MRPSCIAIIIITPKVMTMITGMTVIITIIRMIMTILMRRTAPATIIRTAIAHRRNGRRRISPRAGQA